MLILLACIIGTAAGCMGKGKESKKTSAEDARQEEVVEIESTKEILQTVWDDFFEEDTSEDERMRIVGGGYDNMVSDEPGVIDTADSSSLMGLLSCPEDASALIDGAASMIHALNANSFTAAAYHVKESSDQKVLADALKDSIENTRWMCGFPEVMIIAGVGNGYVVTAIGNTDIVEHFQMKLTEQYDAAILYEESLM